MEKKKISLWSILSICIIILLVISVLVILYFVNEQRKNDNEKISKLQQNEILLNEKITNLQKNETTHNTVTDSTPSNTNVVETPSKEDTTKVKIPMNELCALTYIATNESINLFYGYIDDGKLFYSLDNQTADVNSNTAFQYLSTENIKQYNGLSNIKRIKIFNFGTDVNRVPLLITKDGKVYEISTLGKELEVSLFESLNDYNIDNILEVSEPDMTNDTMITKCKIQLNDGTIKTIEI